MKKPGWILVALQFALLIALVLIPEQPSSIGAALYKWSSLALLVAFGFIVTLNIKYRYEDSLVRENGHKQLTTKKRLERCFLSQSDQQINSN